MIRKLYHSLKGLMTATKKAAARATTRPLRCGKCGTTDVTVSGAQQQLRREGRTKGPRLYARVTCANGHEWWSRHPEALRLSRLVDQARTATGPKLGQ